MLFFLQKHMGRQQYVHPAMCLPKRFTGKQEYLIDLYVFEHNANGYQPRPTNTNMTIIQLKIEIH